MSDYTNPDALVSTEWLADNLDNPNIRIIEVDEDVEAYTQGHIRNALGWDWSVDLHHPVRRDYLDQPGFSDLLSKAGVDRDTTVVLYGGNNNWFAAYAYWLLKYRASTTSSSSTGAVRSGSSKPGSSFRTFLPSTRATSKSSVPHVLSFGRCAMRCSLRWGAPRSSTFAPPKSSPARSWPPITCPRSSRT